MEEELNERLDDLLNINFDEFEFDEDMFQMTQPRRSTLSQQSHEEQSPIQAPNNIASRFANLSKENQEQLISARIPESTMKKQVWASKLFLQWHKERQELILNNKKQGLLVLKEIHEWTASDWNLLLKEFLLEARKENKEKYTASSLKDLFSMLQHYCQNTLKVNINFWTNVDMLQAREALDASMKDSSKNGKVSGLHASEPISHKMELDLWSNGMLGTHEPKTLLFTLIYYIGKHFAIRGRTELHRLQIQQLSLKFENNEEVLYFVENTNTKARNGGIRSRPKPIRNLQCMHTNNHERCLVCIWKLYASKRPEDCHTNNVFLTWYRNEDSIKMGRCWAVLGRHTLDGIVKTLTNTVQTSGNYNNQSLRKTTATALHKAGVERADIAKVTGHSSSAIENYIRLDSNDHSRITQAIHSGGQGDRREVEHNSESLRFNGPTEKKMRIRADGERNFVEITFH